jgi:hypothetical protein
MATRKPNGFTFNSMGTKETSDKSMVKRIKYWSFSLYNAHRQCPFAAKLRAVDKIKTPGNKYMDRGNDVHKICEDYIKGDVIWKTAFKRGQDLEMPADLSGLKDELDRLRGIYSENRKRSATATQTSVEDTWAFTNGWDQTVWNDWIGCWVRIKLDVGHWENHGGKNIYIPTDWKTGKFNEESNDDYIEQLELYALGALLMYPHADEIWPRLIYTDAGLVFPDPEDPIVFRQSDVPALKKLWEKRVRPMLNDTTFAPRPGNYCKFCHFRKGNAAAGGGQCKY